MENLCQTTCREDLPWQKLQTCFIFNRTMKNLSSFTPCGKILAHAKQQVVSFREHLGLGLCVHKIGVTSSPVHRFKSYWASNFTMMWIIFHSSDISMIHMLEAALISECSQHRGCRNAPNSGGEGFLNKKNRPTPPYFVYIVGARADQRKSVG